VRDIHFGNDAPFSFELAIQKVNNDLANNLGNLLSRTGNLISKYFDGKAPGNKDQALSAELRALAAKTCEEVRNHIEALQPSYAMESIVKLLNEANKFLETHAPWKMAKDNLPQAGEVLHTALEVLRVAGILLEPVMPAKIGELLLRLSVQDKAFTRAQEWNGIPAGTPISKGDPLFPRVEASEMIQ
jgi:methionyl-tRNA synthetase